MTEKYGSIKFHTTRRGYVVKECLLYSSFPLEQRDLNTMVEWTVPPHKSLAVFFPPFLFFFSCYSLSRDDRLAGCLRSSEQCLLLSWIPGDGRATSLSDLAAPGHSRDKPIGVPRLGLHGYGWQAWPWLRLTPSWSATRSLWGDLPSLAAVAYKLQPPPPRSYPTKKKKHSFPLCCFLL